MRYLVYSVLGLLFLTSCAKDEQLVGFRLDPEGFALEEGGLFVEEGISGFPHKLAGGVFTFTGTDGVYTFDTKRTGIGEFVFRLPGGDYLMECEIPDASLYGQPMASFDCLPQRLTVSDTTETIPVDVAADCALILVDDAKEQLEHGAFFIERHSTVEGYFASYPLSRDTVTDLFYAYFLPDSVPEDPSAFLWFYEGKPGREDGGLSTTGFETGYSYLIRILE